MKKIIFASLFIIQAIQLHVHAQEKRLAFQQGDLMFYVLSGYPKVPDLTVFGLGDEITDIPPIGVGFQISILDYLSLGGDFAFTYIKKKFALQEDDTTFYRQDHHIVLGKILFHYPLRFFDPYLGGGFGYKWIRHEIVDDLDSSDIFWAATVGFRLAFGNGAPFGIFIESSFPYPLIAGGFYFRFRVY